MSSVVVVVVASRDLWVTAASVYQTCATTIAVAPPLISNG